MKTIVHNITNKQTRKAKERKQKIYELIKTSKVIQNLNKCCVYNGIQPIINLETYDELNRTYFEFYMDNPLHYGSTLSIKYKITGNYLETEETTNIIYIIRNLTDNILNGVYVEKTIKIDNNIILNEAVSLDTKNQKRKAEYISIVFNKENAKEEYIIDPDSEIYKLYAKGLIDINTLCNLVLLQEHNDEKIEIIKQDKKTKTKKLSKKFYK